jgi:hypothetical protein
MIVLKNVEIEESLIKANVKLRKRHICAFCGEGIPESKTAIKASFRYDNKLYPLYFHANGDSCFFKFQHNNTTHDTDNN